MHVGFRRACVQHNQHYKHTLIYFMIITAPFLSRCHTLLHLNTTVKVKQYETNSTDEHAHTHTETQQHQKSWPVYLKVRCWDLYYSLSTQRSFAFVLLPLWWFFWGSNTSVHCKYIYISKRCLRIKGTLKGTLIALDIPSHPKWLKIINGRQALKD